MVGKSLARSALAIMALLAASVAIYSLRLYGVLANNWLDGPGNSRGHCTRADPGAGAYADRADSPISRPIPVLYGTARKISASTSMVGSRLCRGLRGCRNCGTGGFALCVRRPGRGTWLRNSGGTLGLHHARRVARRRATPVCAASFVDAVQLRDDVWRSDFAAANSPRICAGIPKLLGNVGMARLYLLDSERDRSGALFDDEGSAPFNAIRHGLIFPALFRGYPVALFFVMAMLSRPKDGDPSLPSSPGPPTSLSSLPPNEGVRG